MNANDLTAILTAIASYNPDALDMIIEFADDITQSDADLMMDSAAYVDPTSYGFGAEIRDTLRDNTELNVL